MCTLPRYALSEAVAQVISAKQAFADDVQLSEVTEEIVRSKVLDASTSILFV